MPVALPGTLVAEMWLIVREAAKRASHVRAVADLLFEYVETMRDDLAGTRGKGRTDRTHARKR